MATIKTHYQIVTLDEVMRHFIKDFEFPAGRTLFQSEHFIDTAKGVVVFKLVTDDA